MSQFCSYCLTSDFIGFEHLLNGSFKKHWKDNFLILKLKKNKKKKRKRKKTRKKNKQTHYFQEKKSQVLV